MSSSRAPIRVAAAVITRGTTFLICQRPAGKSHAGQWEFPGGKFEAGESLEDAMARELLEELGVAVTRIGPNICTHQEPDSPYRIEFHHVEIEGDPTPLEHSAIRFVEIDELLSLDLAPTDRLVAESIHPQGSKCSS